MSQPEANLTDDELRHLYVNYCIHGHEFTPENTGRKITGDRYCKQCVRDRARSKQKRRSREK